MTHGGESGGMLVRERSCVSGGIWYLNRDAGNVCEDCCRVLDKRLMLKDKNFAFDILKSMEKKKILKLRDTTFYNIQENIEIVGCISREV